MRKDAYIHSKWMKYWQKPIIPGRKMSGTLRGKCRSGDGEGSHMGVQDL